VLTRFNRRGEDMEPAQTKKTAVGDAGSAQPSRARLRDRGVGPAGIVTPGLMMRRGPCGAAGIPEEVIVDVRDHRYCPASMRRSNGGVSRKSRRLQLPRIRLRRDGPPGRLAGRYYRRGAGAELRDASWAGGAGESSGS